MTSDEIRAIFDACRANSKTTQAELRALFHTHQVGAASILNRFTVTADPTSDAYTVYDSATARKVRISSAEVRQHTKHSAMTDLEAARELGAHQLTAPIPVEAHAAVVRELEDLKRRFESLFHIPADKVGAPKIEAAPEHPGQWKIRVRVEAFEVETTIGELSAARANPGAALTWWMRVRDAVPHDTIKRAMALVEQEIAVNVLTRGVAEDAQPNTDSEKKEESGG